MITKCRCLGIFLASSFAISFALSPFLFLRTHFTLQPLPLTNEERACRENRLYVCAGLHACPQFLNSFIIMRLNSVEMMK